MLVERTIELDIPNQGNQFVEPIATTTDWVRRGAPLVATSIGMAIAEWRKLDSRIAQALSGHFRNRGSGHQAGEERRGRCTRHRAKPSRLSG